MPVLAQGPLAGPPVVEGALPCWASAVPEGPALQENCPVCPAAASLQGSRTNKLSVAHCCNLSNRHFVRWSSWLLKKGIVVVGS